LASLLRPTAEVLSKALSGFTDEEQKLIFWNAHYGDALSFSLGSKKVRGLFARYEERLGQLSLVRLPLVQ
jgi:hypothetical protein